MTNIVVGEGGASTLELRSLVDLVKLQRIQDEFAADTGLALITVDALGTPVSTESNFSEFCKLLRRDPEVRKRCFSCDAHGGFQSAIEGKPVVYQCHAGLVDFSVSIMLGQHYLGAILAGQVLLDKGQDALGQLVGASKGLQIDDEVRAMFDAVKVMPLQRLQKAADEIVKLANDSLSSRASSFLASAVTGPYLRRLPAIANDDTTGVLAPLMSGNAKPLPLVPVQSPPGRPMLEATAIAANVQTRNIAGNLDLLNKYLDALLPRWSQKIKRSELGEFEDLLIGIATGEAVQHGRDISQVVIRNRNGRGASMNRYECQVYCERLLIQLHNLIEPTLEARERSIASLLNEIEKDPTSFLHLPKAAEYLMWSESHFARKFKERTGQSFISYVTSKRLERAKFLLTHTTKPVLRIALDLEFQPVNYFSRTFHKHVGVSPSEYRRQHTRTSSA